MLRKQQLVFQFENSSYLQQRRVYVLCVANC